MRIIIFSKKRLKAFFSRATTGFSRANISRFALLVLPAALTLSCTQKASEPVETPAAADATEQTSGDAELVTAAYINGLKEIELCDHAFKMITNQELKDAAEALINAHDVTNKELQEVASASGITLPQGLPENMRKDLFTNDDKSGPQFDRMFADRIVSDHKENIAVYEAGTKSTDPKVKDFFMKRLPELQGHLQMIDKAQATINDKDYSLSK